MDNSVMCWMWQLVQSAEDKQRAVDSLKSITQTIVKDVTTTQGLEKTANLLQQLLDWGVGMGMRIVAATIIFVVGRLVIKLLNRLARKILNARNIDLSVKTFLESFINITLLVLLIVAVISKLGVETTSFAALLASFGVAIGMALSGNLQNLAGGILILLFKPYRVGDFINTQGQEGTVVAIQIFIPSSRLIKESKSTYPMDR